MINNKISNWLLAAKNIRFGPQAVHIETKPEGDKKKKVLQYQCIVGLFLCFHLTWKSQKGTKRKVGHPNSGTIGTVGTAPLLLHTHALMYITS